MPRPLPAPSPRRRGAFALAAALLGAGALVGTPSSLQAQSPASPLKHICALEHLELLATVLKAKGRARASGCGACERAGERLERVLASLREEEGPALADESTEDEDGGVVVLG